ncbi:MAG: hypothetical protein KDK36_22405 [Leptospiraceae bacterium]|nr:hypothetical protein [Leptospiraceae bacterium]
MYGFGNLFFGGLLGWFIVDPASGAMFALDAESKESLILEKIEKDKKGKVVIKPKKKLNILVDHSAASVDLYIFNRGRIRINDEVSKSFKFGKEESLEFNSNVNNYTLKFDYFGLDTDGCFKVNDDVEEVSFYFTLPFFRFSDPEIEIKNTKTGETIPHGCLSK